MAVRTAYRDLDFLRDEWRVPLEYDHHQGTYLLTEPVASLPLVSLSQGELLAIYFAEKVLRQYRGTPFEPDLASAFAKMQELVAVLAPASLRRAVAEELKSAATAYRVSPRTASEVRRWACRGYSFGLAPRLT